jgi:predicted transcriptional regulator of viral defense system
MSKQSIEAYRKAVETGLPKTIAEKIYVLMDEWGPMNLDAMRKVTKVKHQTLTATLSMMQDAGAIHQNEHGVWRIVWLEAERKKYAELRRKTRFLKWVRLGESEGFFEEYREYIKEWT